jgi:hypothetical protein
MRGIEVRWGREEDVESVDDLLEFDGRTRNGAEGDRFIVARENGGDFRVLAAARVRATPSRMDLWGFVADPRVNEGEFAAELYSGAWKLASELGVPEVWVDDDRRRDGLIAAGYRRRIGGWKFAGETAFPPSLFGIFGA